MQQFSKKTLLSILRFLSIRILRKYQPRIIGVTGNVGKSSFKETLYTGLAPVVTVSKTEKSLPSEWSVPLVILQRPCGFGNPLSWLVTILVGIRMIIFRQPYPRVLIVELGADRPGDIESILKWLTPFDACITRLPEVPIHLEFFGSREAIVKEKALVARALPAEGLLLLNADDDAVLELSPETRARVITYGFAVKSQVRGKNFKLIYTEKEGISHVCGSRMDILIPGGQIFRMETNLIQKNLMGLVLGAVAYAYAREYPLEPVIEALTTHLPAIGRGTLIPGKSGSLIIDESYTASPVAVEAALETLGGIKASGKKIAILGDMHELGKESVAAHRELGKLVAKTADILVTVGEDALQITNLAFAYGIKKEAIFSFDTAREAGKYVATILAPGDVILCKGGEAMYMEKAVRYLMERPRDARTLLVRQD